MKNIYFILTVCLVVVFAGFSCQTNQKEQKEQKYIQKNPTDSPKISANSSKAKKTMFDSLKAFQTLKIGKFEVDIKIPTHIPASEIKGNILILQGWAFPKDDWCKKSTLCQKALAAGYRLIMPEMGKSVYSSKYYKETLKEWRVFPKRGWLTDTVFKELQEKYGIMLAKNLSTEKNYIIGLSTGGRGVALVALDKPELFTACAALSGDYDQAQMPTDRVMAGFYGSFATQAKRWQNEDNVLARIAEWKTPIYIGHGKKDVIVPPEQSKLFYDAIKKNHPNLNIKLNMPTNNAHDYKYWDSEVDNMLKFFEM